MKSLYQTSYKLLISWLSSNRLLSGMTQQELSTKLNKPQSFVSKYENAERRLDFVETIDICNILDIDPHEVIDIIKDNEKNDNSTNN